MSKIIIEIKEEFYDKIVDFCQDGSCQYCPFKSDNSYIECYIGKPEYWDIIEEEDE